MVRLLLEWFPHGGLSIAVNCALMSLVTLSQPVEKELPVQAISLNFLNTTATSEPLPENTTPEPVKKKPVKKEVKEIPKKAKTLKKLKPIPAPKTIPLKQEAEIEEAPSEKTPEVNEKVPSKAQIQDSTNGHQASTVIHKARYLKQTPPRYPRRALRLNQEGLVKLHVLISPKGLPTETKVSKSSGYPLLDREALRAVKSWVFHPEQVNGKLKAVWAEVPVRFKIR